MAENPTTNEEEILRGMKNIELALAKSSIVAFNQDLDLRYTWIQNPHPEFEPHTVLGKTDLELLSIDDAYRLMKIKNQVIETGIGIKEEVQLTIQSSVVSYDLSIAPVFNDTGKVIGIAGLSTDITKLKQLEAHLLQSEKMTMIGALAAGIAHDFNNLLVPILGLAGLVHLKLDPDSKESGRLKLILESAQKAKALVEQIQAIGHNGEIRAESVRLETILKDTLKLIRTSIPATISIQQQIDSPLPAILADPTQVHQVLMNLCINAWQAMPEGGMLSVKLESISHYSFMNTQGRQTKGAFVCLSIQDDGSGIDPLIRNQIFAPFFSTKERGSQQGMGLGLTLVSKIIEQHSGHIEIESELTKGTTIKVFFPAIAANEDTVSPDEPVVLPETMGVQILLVDDDILVNDSITDMLKTLGYHVMSFTISTEALKAFESDPELFHLVITDYHMPNLNGVQLVEQIQTIRPGCPVLMLTGHTHTDVERTIQEWDCMSLLKKPFDFRKFSRTVKSVLDQGGGVNRIDSW